MNVSVKQVYTSVACNRTPEIVDWNNEGLICFGAKNAVVIYNNMNKDGTDPLTVLSHHQSDVNSVKWILKPDGTCKELVSCSADKTAAIWSLVDGVWKVTSTLKGHTEGVTCIHGIYSGEKLFVFTAAIDSTMKVWERINGEATLKHSICLNSGLCLTLHAHILPIVNQPILFCGLDDHKIHIYAGDDYHRVHTLVGHEDWVRGMDVLDVDDSTILLASASQDTYIRLWRIQQHIEEEPSPQIKVEEKIFHAYGQQWSVKLDAVLLGHEGWVYGVQWQPQMQKGSKKPIYRLLSSSLDKTLILWEPTSSGGDGKGIWVESVRVGEVGGNGLGFYGSRFGPDGKAILGHGYNGSFHIWRHSEEMGRWVPTVVCGGHYNTVEDVRWEPHKGRYIMSVSTDQTTRAHAPWKIPNGAVQWHEIGRPQVHGYDMTALAAVSSSLLVSAADEKVLRVFRATLGFARAFHNIVGEPLDTDLESWPEVASVPSLGLSNKAVTAGDDENDNDEAPGHAPDDVTVPPTEEHLMEWSLWPEQHKLYGHGYEVFALDASPDGTLVASACKAAAKEHAALIIWETKHWQQVQKLESHQLTVTQIAFSPDSQQLLTVSRDRTWTLSQRREGSYCFDIIARTDKTNGVHTRIIWCCAWAHDGCMFTTGSRDGKVCVWSKSDTVSESSLKAYSLLGKPLTLSNASVTAVAFAPLLLEQSRIVAVGLESGVIRIYSFDNLWSQLYELDKSAAHHLSVKRLMFRPKTEDNEDSTVLLASCGADNFVRIHRLAVTS